MADQRINLSFSIKEIFELIPEMAAEGLKVSPKAQEITDSLKGTEFTFVFEFDGEKYNMVVKDGTDFKSGLGDLDKPMFRISMSIADIEKLMDIKNARMFIGRQGGGIGGMGGGMMQPSADKLSQLSSTFSGVRGAMNMVLIHDDDSESKFRMVFNDSPESELTVKITMADAKELMTGESNPVSMFMGGRIQIEGDISIAMSFQSLLM